MMCWFNKEVRYFSRGRNAGVGICWYRDRYSCLPQTGTTYAVFDGSPDYFVIPEADVASMAVTLGSHTHLVAMLRNPADRFYSAYNMGMSERKRRTSASDATYDEFAGRSSLAGRTWPCASPYAHAFGLLIVCLPPTTPQLLLIAGFVVLQAASLKSPSSACSLNTGSTRSIFPNTSATSTGSGCCC